MSRLAARVSLSLALLGLAPASLACGGASTPPSRLAAPPAFRPAGQTKCQSATSQSEPLVVEWPSPARTKLEALAKEGLVAVRYTGCEMEIISACKVSGAYGYTPLTRKRDHVTVRDADELYAKIPLGAASLEGTLHRAGQLDVSMTIVGRYAADRAPAFGDLHGEDCERATHVVSALTIGAFDFVAGGSADVGGGVEVGGAGAGAESRASREVLNSDGDEERCTAASAADQGPPDGCGAIVRLEVMPVADGGRARAKVDPDARRDRERDAAPRVADDEPPSPRRWSPPAPVWRSRGAGARTRTIRIVAADDGATYRAQVQASDGAHGCEAPVTRATPCTLDDVPVGRAVLQVSGDAEESRPIESAMGSSQITIAHHGHAAAAGIFAGIGAAGIAAAVYGYAQAQSSSSSSSSSSPALGNTLLESIGLAAACVGVYGFFYALKAPTNTIEEQRIAAPPPADVAVAPAAGGGATVNALLRF